MPRLAVVAPLVSIALAGGYALVGDSIAVALLLFFLGGPLFVLMGLNAVRIWRAVFPLAPPTAAKSESTETRPGTR